MGASRQCDDLRSVGEHRAAPPDYQAIRDRTLTKLKMGSQSSAGKAIDAFIKELAKLPMPNTQSPDLGNLAVGLLVDLAIAEWRKHKTEMRYFEDLRRIAKLCGYQLFTTTKGYEAKEITSNKLVFNTGEIGAIVEWLRTLNPRNAPKEQTEERGTGTL